MQPNRYIDKPNRDAPAPERPSRTPLVYRFLRGGLGDGQGFGVVLLWNLLSGNNRRKDGFWPGNSCVILFGLALW